MFASISASRDQVSFLALRVAVQPQSQSWAVSRLFYLLCRHSPCCLSSSRAPHHPNHHHTGDISATSLKKPAEVWLSAGSLRPKHGWGSREGKHHSTYKMSAFRTENTGKNAVFLRKAIACPNVGFTSPNPIWNQQNQDWFPKGRVREWRFMDWMYHPAFANCLSTSLENFLLKWKCDLHPGQTSVFKPRHCCFIPKKGLINSAAPQHPCSTPSPMTGLPWPHSSSRSTPGSYKYSYRRRPWFKPQST